MTSVNVIMLPGAVMPAEPAYAALIDVLGSGVDARIKDLEVYATEQPPADYSLDSEVGGLLRLADDAGLDSFHAVGYSAGGASVLATVAAASERVRSVALLEPAWAGWTGISEAEAAIWERIRDVMRLPDGELMRSFVEVELAPGVTPPAPPPGPPPDWMRKRPAGLRAILRAFDDADIDPGALRAFDRPVYYALGGLSHPDLYAQIAERLGGLFPDFTLERFEERHHFEPPHRLEPERVARALQALWKRTEERSPD